MSSFAPSKPAIAVFAGLSLVGALAGCSATPASTTAGTGDTATTAPTAPSVSSGSSAAPASAYKDGTYKESADYQAPSGTETVDVSLTLAGGTITAVTVAGHGTDPQAQLHQRQFADGIAAVVVGKSIDGLSVDKVGGSSLTSVGFNKAVDAIKTDAAA
ncbi:MAG: FMN-binding protein [Rhodoglobus sp.]